MNNDGPISPILDIGIQVPAGSKQYDHHSQLDNKVLLINIYVPQIYVFVYYSSRMFW